MLGNSLFEHEKCWWKDVNYTSHHLGEFKLHFNNFLILESTDNSITSKLDHFSITSEPWMIFASKQALSNTQAGHLIEFNNALGN